MDHRYPYLGMVTNPFSQGFVTHHKDFQYGEDVGNRMEACLYAIERLNPIGYDIVVIWGKDSISMRCDTVLFLEHHQAWARPNHENVVSAVAIVARGPNTAVDHQGRWR